MIRYKGFTLFGVTKCDKEEYFCMISHLFCCHLHQYFDNDHVMKKVIRTIFYINFVYATHLYTNMIIKIEIWFIMSQAPQPSYLSPGLSVCPQGLGLHKKITFLT